MLHRSYHHLFPILPFEELSSQGLWDRQAALKTEEVAAASTSHHSLTGQGGQEGSESEGPGLSCFGCMRSLHRAIEAASRASASGFDSSSGGDRSHAPPMVLKCPMCDQVFCYECDVYIHESLHNCPGCETILGSGVKREASSLGSKRVTV